MSRPTKQQLAERIRALLERSIALGYETLRYLSPEYFEPESLLEMVDLTAGQSALFVFDAETGLTHLVVLAPEEIDHFGLEVRDELEELYRGWHKAILLFTIPMPGPRAGLVHYGLRLMETHGRDDVETYELAVYDEG